LEAELFEPKLESLEEGLGVLFILECADEIVSVSDQARFTLGLEEPTGPPKFLALLFTHTTL
jgi:hypothetical protein